MYWFAHISVSPILKRQVGGMLNYKPKKRVKMLDMKDHMLVNQFEKEWRCVLDASPHTSSSSDSWNSLCDAIYN